jgi:hypothetical protein
MLNGVKHLDEIDEMLHSVQHDSVGSELLPEVLQLALLSNSRYHAVCDESSPFLRLSGS